MFFIYFFHIDASTYSLFSYQARWVDWILRDENWETKYIAAQLADKGLKIIVNFFRRTNRYILSHFFHLLFGFNG